MSYTRGNLLALPAVQISTLGAWGVVDRRLSTASTAWPTQYLAVYVPVLVHSRLVILKLAVANGGTASGNFDLGLYDAAGTRLVSTGSTAQSGVSAEQVVDVTDTTIGPGLYYLACCMDGTTGTTRAIAPSAPLPLAYGVLTETLGSVVLPATATFAADQTLAMIPRLYAYIEGTAT